MLSRARHRDVATGRFRATSGRRRATTASRRPRCTPPGCSSERTGSRSRSTTRPPRRRPSASMAHGRDRRRGRPPRPDRSPLPERRHGPGKKVA